MTIALWNRRIALWYHAYLGQERLDTVAHTEALNRFYDGMWVYYNCFQPVMRLSAKEVLPTANGIPKVRRRFDEPGRL